MNFTESETLELKKTTSEIKEAIISIVSILNKNQHGGLTIETIGTKMVSERRNELIAEMLHRVHFIEKWGRGIKLILSKEPDTKFSEVGTKFIATFKRKSFIDDKQELEKGKEKTTQKIIEAIANKSDITQKELAAVIGITEDGVKYHVTRLREKGVLKRIGPDKGGHWEILYG
jgi:ATP-dependent DNA helicase RecG